MKKKRPLTKKAAARALRSHRANKKARRTKLKKTELRVMRRFHCVDLVVERWDYDGGDDPVVLEVYRSKGGDLVDVRRRPKRTRLVRAIEFLRITPQKRHSSHDVCSIGRSATDGRWYGWSHRAFVGFKRGDKVFSERYTAKHPHTPFKGCGTVTIKTEAQAKLAAKRFAAYVS